MSFLHVRHQHNILWLILDRPPLNILSIEMIDQLTAALRDAMKNPPRPFVIIARLLRSCARNTFRRWRWSRVMLSVAAANWRRSAILLLLARMRLLVCQKLIWLFSHLLPLSISPGLSAITLLCV